MLTDTALRNFKPKSKTYKASDRDGMYVTVSIASTKVAGLSRRGISDIQGGAVRPRMLLAPAVQLSIRHPGLPAGRRPGLASCGRSDFWYY